MDEYRKSNRELWNNWARMHFSSPTSNYDVATFKAGRNTLHSVDLEELGDVAGKSLLHLQCHFGADTLSLARLGARVTGVDFSSEAIAIARQLSDELEIPARFVQSDILALPDVLDGQFDIVFTSHGVLGWLPDLRRWGEVVAHFLKPGGTFCLVEGHPFAHVFHGEPGVLEGRYPYFEQPEPLRFETKGSYGDPESDYESVEYYWSHSLSEIVNALLGAGLALVHLREFDFLSWQMGTNMEQGADGYWRLPAGYPPLPFMFALKAVKPG